MAVKGVALFTRADRPPYASHPVIYRIMRRIIVILVRIVYRYRVHGHENIPANGSAMLVVNHLHFFDPAVVAAGVSRQIVTMAAEKWRELWPVRLFLQGAGVIFVRRGEVDRHALRACIEVLNSGGLLAVAPEGTRSRTGGLQRGKPGVAYLATRTHVPIVPIAFWGVEKVGSWKKLRRPICHMVIGRPFRLPEVTGRMNAEQLQAMTDLIMVEIGKLLPEEYRGVYKEQILKPCLANDSAKAAA